MAHVLAHACFTQDAFTTTKKKNSNMQYGESSLLKAIDSTLQIEDKDDEKKRLVIANKTTQALLDENVNNNNLRETPRKSRPRKANEECNGGS
nr:13775_t:CDS:2 [Entrophospora candida]